MYIRITNGIWMFYIKLLIAKFRPVKIILYSWHIFTLNFHNY